MKRIAAFLKVELIDSPYCEAYSIKAACSLGENLDYAIGILYQLVRINRCYNTL